jgi:Anti-sigma regulatory factor (Ser/Thr protein kinase)
MVHLPMEKEAPVTLRAGASMQGMGRLMAHVQQEVRQRGVDELQEGRLLLVLEELFTNIVRCAYPEASKAGEAFADTLFFDASPCFGSMGIRIEPSREGEDTLHFTIFDWGMAFDPTTLPPPDIFADIDERKIGGLGMHLVRNMVSGIKYHRVSEEADDPLITGRNDLSLSIALRS